MPTAGSSPSVIGPTSRAFVGPDTQTIDLGDGCVMPGFIEAHGHPLMEAVALSDRIVDIRPVTVPSPDDVVAAVRREAAARGTGRRLPQWLGRTAAGRPAAADAGLARRRRAGRAAGDHPQLRSQGLFQFACRTAQRPQPRHPRPQGRPLRPRRQPANSTAPPRKSARCFRCIGGAISPSDYPAMLRAECARLNRAGLTTCSDMAFDPNFGPLVEQLRDELTVRLRTYEVSNPQMSTAATPGQGDDMLRQVGIKIWVDGSPWIGNIALSFPYLDTAATRAIGVTPGSCGCANYTAEQLTEIVGAYFPLGWQMACHVQGDAGRRHHPRRVRAGAASQPARRPPAAARARRRHPARATPARRRSRRHLQHLRRPDPLLG